MLQEYLENDKILITKAKDMLLLSNKRNCPQFSNYLDEYEASVYLDNIQKNIGKYDGFVALYGGYSDSERLICAVFPDRYKYATKQELFDLFPVTPVTITFNKSFAIAHKDVLGSLMSLGIKREMIGDIFIDKGTAVFFSINSAVEYIISQIDKIGRVGVKLSIGCPTEFNLTRKFEEFSGIITSDRIDSFVALVTKKSRNISQEIIASKQVSINGKIITDVSYRVNPDDKISVRKYGKFVYLTQTSQTKSGRMVIQFKKYI